MDLLMPLWFHCFSYTCRRLDTMCRVHPFQCIWQIFWRLTGGCRLLQTARPRYVHSMWVESWKTGAFLDVFDLDCKYPHRHLFIYLFIYFIVVFLFSDLSAEIKILVKVWMFESKFYIPMPISELFFPTWGNVDFCMMALLQINCWFVSITFVTAFCKWVAASPVGKVTVASVIHQIKIRPSRLNLQKLLHKYLPSFFC